MLALFVCLFSNGFFGGGGGGSGRSDASSAIRDETDSMPAVVREALEKKQTKRTIQSEKQNEKRMKRLPGLDPTVEGKRGMRKKKDIVDCCCSAGVCWCVFGLQIAEKQGVALSGRLRDFI